MIETTGCPKDKDTRGTPRKAGTVGYYSIVHHHHTSSQSIIQLKQLRVSAIMKIDIINARAYAARPTPLSAALTAAVKSRWKNGVSGDTSGAYPMGGESISESDFLTSPDSRSLSTPNRGDTDSLAYGTTAAISC